MTSRSRPAAEWWSLVVAVVVSVSIGLLLPHEPDRVTVTIENRSDHRLDITASTPDDPGLSFVTIVGPRTTKAVPYVVDRGPTWVLHLRIPGTRAATIEASRADLASGSLVIPPDVAVDPATPLPDSEGDR